MKNQRYRTIRVKRIARKLGKKILSNRPRRLKLRPTDAQEAQDVGFTSSAASFTVDASKYGASLEVQDLALWDTWNGSKASILGSKFIVNLAASAVNTNFSAALVLVQSYGEGGISDLTDLTASESVGQALTRQFTGKSMKYRVLNSKQARIIPSPTGGSYIAQLEIKIGVDKIWKQLERFAGEQTGMSTMPGCNYKLMLVIKSTANCGLRTFTHLEKRFKLRASNNQGL